MGLLDFIKNSKKKKVEKLSVDEIKKEKMSNDSVFCIVDAKQNKAENIRLCYLSLQEFNGNDEQDTKLEVNYGATCVYKAPEGMSLEEIYQIVSYVSKLNNDRYNIAPATEISMQCAGADLEHFGFKKQERHAPHYSRAHIFADYNPNADIVKVETNNLVKTDLEGVTDLMTVDGDLYLFMISDLVTKNSLWFRMRSDFEDIKQIYDRLGINIDRDGVVKTQVKER